MKSPFRQCSRSILGVLLSFRYRMTAHLFESLTRGRCSSTHGSQSHVTQTVSRLRLAGCATGKKGTPAAAAAASFKASSVPYPLTLCRSRLSPAPQPPKLPQPPLHRTLSQFLPLHSHLCFLCGTPHLRLPSSSCRVRDRQEGDARCCCCCCLL